MKKNEPNASEMRAEYDFTGKQGKRGKYYQAYRDGHSVRIIEPDGTASVQYFGLEDGAVMLEPDVRAVFPDSESVNAALRSLIELMEHMPKNKHYPPHSADSRQVADR
jgi:hypothetical protein